ncbi:hypothetical protein SLE2022_138130 [Rubroshorea leprosula]
MLNHFSHPLVLVEEEIGRITGIYYCSACRNRVEGSYYDCSECDFYLHKSCAELPREINHPFHLDHPLILYEKRPRYPSVGPGFICNSCGKLKGADEFVYHCSSCKFDLDIKCALLPNLITGDLPKLKHFSHQHSLCFLQNHYVEPQDQSCSACEEPISGPVYCCFDLIKSLNHGHPFILVSKPFSFVCNACGTDGEYCFPYVCTECDIAVHKDCISLPQKIKITRHKHPIFHIYFLANYEGKNNMCRICRDEINMEYGSYHCLQCDYLVHVNCATAKNLRDKEYFEVKHESKKSNEALKMPLDEWASITGDLEERSRGDQDVSANEIKHFSHQHNLILSNEIKDDTVARPGSYMATISPSISASRKTLFPNTADFSPEHKEASWMRLKSSSNISSRQPFFQVFTSGSRKFEKAVVRAASAANDENPLPGLPIDLRGKRAFIAGVADDDGYGWAIAKSLAAAGAEILVGTWVPTLNIFESSLRCGKFDESRVLPDGSLMEITKVYPMDAVYDCPEDVPEDVKTNKRYSGSSSWTVQEVVECVKKDFGSIDILIHSLANGPEVSKPLLETSRNGYLAVLSASSYSFVSLLKHFAPIMNPGGASISLTYIASERIIPGYGGGMSSAKAALESNTRVLAFEAGRKHKIRVNTISAGPLRSRTAKAIGFIDMMIDYSLANAPLQKELSAEEVGNAAAFLASPLASAITGAVVDVDNDK